MRDRPDNARGLGTFQPFTRLAITRVVLLAGLAVACTSGDDSATTGADSGGGTTTSSTAMPGGEPMISDLGIDTSTAPPALPSELAAVAEFGEKLYDAAKASEWDDGRAIMDSLERAVRSLPVGANAQSADGLELPRVLDSLRQSVSERRRDGALQLSNRVTYLAAKMSTGYHPQIPSGIVLLDYSGRELEIWSAKRNARMLKRTSEDLSRIWDAVRPDVVRHGGTTAAETMDSLVTRVASAKTAADYARIATPILDHVDVLESVYTKP